MDHRWDREITWARAFDWGLLTVVDEGYEVILPDGFETRPVDASETTLTVLVHHASDVDAPAGWPADAELPPALVTIRVLVGSDLPPDPAVHVEQVLPCPTGRIEVGDADENRVIDVPPGSVRIRVLLEPEEDADSVTLQLAPADPAEAQPASASWITPASGRSGTTSRSVAGW